MGIVNFSQASFLTSFSAPLLSPAQSLIRWLRLSQQPASTASLLNSKPDVGRIVPQNVRTVGRRPSPFAVKNPGREHEKFHAPAVNRITVVREADSAVQRGVAGRMVISGRMADVCAELDRMVQSSDITRP